MAFSIAPGSILNTHQTSQSVLEKISISCGSDCSINLQGINVLNTRLKILMGNSCHLDIGQYAMMNGPVTIYMHEPSRLIIGQGCLFANTQIWTSDMHSVLDAITGARINPAQDIRIGNHVWLGEESLILKGSDVGDNSIVAAKALVSGIFPSNVVIGGVPAKVVREGINWSVDLR
jgi:acetyltransferase-like isoleucine patch superfamily enzyme